jgi:hypothetical protein
LPREIRLQRALRRERGKPGFEHLVDAPGNAALGQCTREDPHLGWCYVPVEDGKAGSAICVD